jgi:Zn-dependent membrane protease YugP
MIDPIWFLFAIPGLLLGIYAQMRLRSAYGRYAQVGVSSGLTDAQAAREVLDRAGLVNVPVREVRGHLTDHYDPLKKALFLSSDNFHRQSIAAVGVAAHEAGHALQHAAAYAPLKLRMALVPVTSFAGSSSIWLVFGGVFLGWSSLAMIGVILYAVITLFQLVTLPVEYDASRRAKSELQRLGLVRPNEAPQVATVLNAAALTYVAGMVAAVMQLLYLLMLARGGSRG